MSLLLAVALACAVLLPMLGHRALSEWDEGIYAEISREMTLGRGWVLVPHWNFQPWMEKPPLMLWITALFYRVFGVSEFWARAGSAFSGVALVGLLHAWLARRKGLATAWMSSLLLLACLGFQHVARVGEMDALLALGITLALIGVANVAEEPAPNSRGWLLFWLGFAIAVMTKGAASAVLPVSVLLLLAMRVVRIQLKAWRGVFGGAALFAVLVLPWHGYMATHFGAAFWHDYLGWQVIQRAQTAMEGHRTHTWYYLWVLLVSAGPTLLVALVAVAKSWNDRIVKVFAIFAAVDVVCFSLSQTRLPHYVAGVYPAMAVVGAIWCGPLVESLWKRGGRMLLAAAVAVAAGLIAVTGGARKKLHAPVMADGSIAVDNREEAKLLTGVFGSPDSSRPHVEPAFEGLLLMLRLKHLSPINTAIFYSGRPVQRVVLGFLSTDDAARDRYMFDPMPLDLALRNGPRLLLVDRDLVPAVELNWSFQPVAESRSLVLGVVKPPT